MIRAPTKPTITAAQRRAPTISPRTRAASRVVKIGAVNPSAVTSDKRRDAQRVEEREHREDVEDRAQAMQTDAPGLQKRETVAVEPGGNDREREHAAEECDLEGMDRFGQMSDRRVHRRKEEGRDEHQAEAAQHAARQGRRSLGVGLCCRSPRSVAHGRPAPAERPHPERGITSRRPSRTGPQRRRETAAPRGERWALRLATRLLRSAALTPVAALAA